MSKLKNSTIIALVQNGIGQTTEHDVPVKDAYKAYAFRHAVEKAHKELEDKRSGLVKSVGIDNPEEFDKRNAELRELKSPTEEQKAELEGMTEKLKKFGELYKELLDDETEINVKAMPYESYHALSNENKAVPIPGTKHTIDLFTVFAGELEGILWVAPED